LTADLEEIQALDERYGMPTYARAPVAFDRGEGSRLWDTEGREYVDLFSGLAVHSAGHCHPRIVTAIREQAGRLAGSSNLYLSEPAAELCRALVTSSLGGRAFLCNSGTEANECAIKLVRRRAHARGITDPEIVVLESGFHGRTLAALTATPKLASEALFGPLPAGFVVVADDEPAALRRAVGPRTAAVIVEPIQGEAGVHPISDEMLLAAREACDRTGAVLHFDEIQTGMGRTGSLWAYEGTPVRPDLITAAKALGGGLPVGACVISPDLGDGLGRGEHGSTFGGGAIGAAAALAALEVLSEPALLEGVRKRGAELREACAQIDGVEEVRGRGLMLGLGLAAGLDATELASNALAEGVVVNAPNPSTVRLLPPLTIEPDDLRLGVERLAAAATKAAGRA
jgi:acetylornithine/N-succinyldiaminopimelate aminotransferase